MVAQPSETVTSTAQRLPCTQLYAAYLANPTTLNNIEYNLCLGWHHMTDWALDGTHWLWSEFGNLYNEFWNIISSASQHIGGVVGSAGEAIVKAGKWAGQKIEDAASGLWSDTKRFLTWLDQATGRMADRLYGEFGDLGKFLLYAGLLFFGIEAAGAVASIGGAVSSVAGGRRRRRKK